MVEVTPADTPLYITYCTYKIEMSLINTIFARLKTPATQIEVTPANTICSAWSQHQHR